MEQVLKIERIHVKYMYKRKKSESIKLEGIIRYKYCCVCVYLRLYIF